MSAQKSQREIRRLKRRIQTLEKETQERNLHLRRKFNRMVEESSPLEGLLHQAANFMSHFYNTAEFDDIDDDLELRLQSSS